MSVVHLNRYQDREESEAHCTGRAEYPSTQDPAEATCVPCLAEARAAAEEEAEACAARIDALFAVSGPVEPGWPPRPAFTVVADDNCPADRAYAISIDEDGAATLAVTTVTEPLCPARFDPRTDRNRGGTCSCGHLAHEHGDLADGVSRCGLCYCHLFIGDGLGLEDDEFRAILAARTK